MQGYRIRQPEPAYADDLLDALRSLDLRRILQPLRKRPQDAVPVMALDRDHERKSELLVVAPVQILYALEFLRGALVQAGALLLES